LNKWIKANKLTFNFDETNFMKFCTNNKTCVNLNIGYDDKSVEEVETTKFLCLQIDSNLNWKAHIHFIICRLSSACFCYGNSHITQENRNFKISFRIRGMSVSIVCDYGLDDQVIKV
jgi:hypothetical protein